MECANDNRSMECTTKTLGFYRHEIEYRILCSLHFPAVVCARIPDRVFGSRKSMDHSSPSHTGLYRIIRMKYGEVMVRSARHHVNTGLKIARQKEHIAFNTRCRRYRIVPNSLRIQPLVNTLEGEKIAQKAGFQFLNAARINDNYRRLRVLSHDLYFQRRQFQHSLLPHHYHALESLAKSAAEKERSKTKSCQKRKFDALLTKSSTRQKRHPEKWVVNLSSKTLTEQQTSVLAKGLNFSIACTKVPIPSMVSKVESALRKVTQRNLVESARLQMIGLFQKSRLPTPNITLNERRALKELKDDKEITILPADKGRAVVVLDSVEYNRKIQLLLDDSTTYRLIEKDPSPSLERKMNSILLSLCKKGELPRVLYDKLRSTAGVTQ